MTRPHRDRGRRPGRGARRHGVPQGRRHGLGDDPLGRHGSAVQPPAAVEGLPARRDRGRRRVRRAERRLRRAGHRPAARHRGDGHRRRRAHGRRWPDGEKLPYDRLVLASGSLPRALGTPGEDARRRASLPHAEGRGGRARRGGVRRERARDRRRLHRHGDDGLAAPPRARRHAGRPGRRASTPRSRPRRSRNRSSGSTARAASRSSSATRSRSSAAADGKLTGAVTDAGREIEAELAIVGVGVQPSTGYLEGTGVDARARHRARRRALRHQRPGHLGRRRHRELPRSRLRPPPSDPALDEREPPGRAPRPAAGGGGRPVRPGGVLLLRGLRHQDRPARRPRRRP